MTADQFVALFGSQCTVGLNWRMIVRDQPKVDVRTVTSRSDLGRLLLLDGLHRAVALWLADRPIRVALAVLRGPTDPGMSWDMEWVR